MKRILSSFAALCLACGVAAPANASSFAINGHMLMEGQMSNNLSSFVEGADAWNHFDVNQRIEVEFTWDYSENLRGQLTARVPSNGTWGNNNDFNTQNMFNLYDAYFQWITPIGGLNIIAGQQAFILPTYMNTETNPVYDDNQTGISLDIPVNSVISVKLDWVRLEAASGRTFASGYANGIGKQKAVQDMYNIIIPVTTSMFDITPWASLSLVEEGRTIETAYDSAYGIGSGALAPVGSEEKNQLAYFAGLTTKFKLIDGLNFGIDALYTGSTMENGEKTNVDPDNGNTTYDITYNAGYLVDAFVSYDLPMLTIGLNGWYASGDKINLDKSTIEYGAILSPCGSWGDGTSAYFANGGIINNVGVSTPAGTLGGGLSLASSPIEKLNVGANVMYVMGTNEVILGGKEVSVGNVDFLTANDSVLDLGARASYDIYDNFQVKLVGNYLIPSYDDIDTENGFVLSAGIRYIF